MQNKQYKVEEYIKRKSYKKLRKYNYARNHTGKVKHKLYKKSYK